MVETITDSFHDDPTWAYAFNDPAARPGQYRRWWRLMIEGSLRYDASWVADDAPLLASLGLSGPAILDRVQQLQDDLFEVWHPFAMRFAALALGSLDRPRETPLPGRRLPMLGQ